jgi:hypothetical protein
MRAPALHATSRNRPDTIFGVDLAPFCAEHFIGARYCQDCKFQS